MNKKRLIQALVLFFFIASACTRFISFQPRFTERICAAVLYPALQLSNACLTPIKHFLQHRHDQQTCLVALHKLQKNYDDLQATHLQLLATTHYYNKIKELLDFQKRYNLKNSISASIIIKELTPHAHIYTIDRGKNHGVTADMIALYKLQIIGKIVEVFDFYSKIMLITDKRCKIATFTNSTNAQGITQGTNKENECELIYVPNTAKIILNDLVFSSGKGLIFPEGFCVGVVANHHLHAHEIYHTITINPLIDLTTLEYCLLTNQSKISLL